MLEIKTGEKYSRFTIINEVERMGGLRRFLCKCDCGTIKEVGLATLRNGTTRSCGCLTREQAQKVSIHGQWDKRVYATWRDMKQRCSNPNNTNYRNYGNRGIQVCEEWIDAKNFIEWAFENGYSDDLTLDRIKSDGNYEPNNCRWVSMGMQQNNKRTNRMIEYKGVKRTIKQWSSYAGVNHETLRRRIDDGWEVEAALFSPSRRGVKGLV